jgi:uncharacterized protein YbjT (DUF2867 family)
MVGLLEATNGTAAEEDMTSPILVTGGTGTLGRRLVPMLRDGGCRSGSKVRVLSRHEHEPSDGIEYVTADLRTGENLGPALYGAETVVHLAGNGRADGEMTARLAGAAARSGVRHLVYISVIAADRIPLFYFRAKAGAEHAVAESGVPWTTLRAAQFHDLVLTVSQKLAVSPVMPVPREVRFQPVDACNVAARLVELARGEPAGRVPDLAGPAVYSLGDLMRGYLTAAGRHRLLVRLRMPGRAGRAYRAGENLNLADATLGTRTWEEFLAERVPRGG